MLDKALVLGPYDWDPLLVPLAEFEARLAAVRSVLADHGANALLVHGDTFDHGALTYLTGFTPKLGPALAFVPLEGDLRICFSGGGAMAESARKLTWVADVRALRDIASDIATEMSQWTRGRLALGVWDTMAMPYHVHCAIRTAVSSRGSTINLQPDLDRLRRRKSPVEQGVIKRLSGVLAAAVGRFRSELTQGSGTRSAALAAEREAYRLGAQDAVVLASRRNGGEPLPFDNSSDPRLECVLASVAARFAGYWAEAYIAAPSSGALAVRSEAALAAAIAKVRPGICVRELLDVADAALHPYQRNSAQTGIGTGMGLALCEAPELSLENTVLQAGDVCSLKIDAVNATADATGARVMTSAMLIVQATGAAVLYASGP